MKHFTTARNMLLFTTLVILTTSVKAQISITTAGVSHTENLNSLSNTTSSSTLPSGWELEEPIILSGNYDVSDGSSATATMYSFGTTSASDRALGSIINFSVSPILFGVNFTNNTSNAISSVTIQYTGEQWRLGALGRTDKLIFEYAIGASDINDGTATWVEVTSLNFIAPTQAGTVGALDGNNGLNRTTLSANIAVNVANNQTLVIRWRDFDASSDDDGLGIDDFSLTAHANLGTGTYPNIFVDGTMQLGGDITITGDANFNSGSKIDIGAHTVTFSGDISGTPTIKGGTNSNIVIDGTGILDTINFDQTTPGTTNVLNSLTMNRSGATLTLGNALNIDVTGSVNPTAGTIATGGNLTLLSSAAGTARIGVITSGVSDVSGNVNAQRFISGGNIDYRGWRTMGPPTSNFTVAELSDDIYVTGPGGATNGFDASGTNSSVMYYEEDFNASGGRGWKSVSSTSAAITAGQGMLVFYRGDRTQPATITAPLTVPNSAVVDINGPINKGDVGLNLSYHDDSDTTTDDGWNFISNPYPSQILWGNVSKDASVDDNIAILNPLTNGYVTYGLTDKIASNQGFFVKVNAVSQSLTFQENNKVDIGYTPYFKTQIKPFVIKMYEDSNRYDIAALKIEANASANYVFKEDALKMTNSRINMGFVTSNNKMVQINTVPTTQTNNSDTFLLRTSSVKNGTHWFTFEDKAMLPSTHNVVLVDLYNNNRIDVKSAASYAFTINSSIPATIGNRFQLIITDQFSALPVKLTSFKGSKVGEKNILDWTTSSEKNLINYEIQKSANGIDFETIGLVKANNTSTVSNYAYTDENGMVSPINYYRLKINEQKGINSFSQIVVLNSNIVGSESFSIYPNPANDLVTINKVEGILIEEVKVFDINGIMMIETKETDNIKLNELKPGVYFIEIRSETKVQNIKFIKL
ncbi:MAG: T9SS type A sorting domain-containing protein [Bacteroidia bacterium]|nr:T9SS type A sorting domain-containing protein [Bacteroidia bacterium]